jgi:hypothetical protein
VAPSILDLSAQAPRVELENYKPVQERIGNHKKSVIVAAAISGGGHRAANFGVGVLMALEDVHVYEDTNVLQEIDYFSTVSGGSFAAGSYISTLYDYLSAETENRERRYESFRYTDFYDTASDGGVWDKEEEFCRSSCGTYREFPVCVRRNIERGYHAPLVTALTSPKIWFTNFDRGDVLEQKIDRRLLASCWRESETSLVLGDVFVPKDSASSPDLPYWVMNSTIYENGAIFPFTPDIAQRYEITNFNHNMVRYCVGERTPGCQAVVDYYGIPLSLGLKASATFPGAVAATTLRSNADRMNPYVHLFDGGIADNLGVLTAIDLLAKDEYAATKGETPVKVLIVIDAYKDDPEPFSSRRGSPTVVFHVSSKLRSITLDSWHGRHRAVIEKMAMAEGIRIVYLGFDTIANSERNLKAARKECESKEKDEVLEIARNVATAFNVDHTQQNALVCAGYMAVQEERENIKAAFAQPSGD